MLTDKDLVEFAALTRYDETGMLSRAKQKGWQASVIESSQSDCLVATNGKENVVAFGAYKDEYSDICDFSLNDHFVKYGTSLPSCQVCDPVYTALMQIYTAICLTLRQGNRDLPLYVTGHSTGGALALFFAMCAHSHPSHPLAFQVTRVTTFGQPAFGDKIHAQHVESILGDKYHRYQNKGDLIPYLGSYHHPRKTPTYCLDGSAQPITLSRTAKAILLLEMAIDTNPWRRDQHSVCTYVQRIQALA